MKTIQSLLGSWPGDTVACLATGPSLTADDCAFVRDKCKVIAINDAWNLAPWADILYSSDRTWWRHYAGVPAFHGRKVGIGSSVGKDNPFHPHPEIVVLKNTGYLGLETEVAGLRNGSNSGYAALNLAVQMGATRVLLLGYNMSYRSGRAHFFGNHPAGLSQNESLHVGFRRSFESMVEPLQALGVDVINCTPDTSLMTFPVADLRDVLREPLAVAS